MHPERQTNDDPASLKEVEDHRYIVCLNEDEARDNATHREAIVASLREKIRGGEKSLVGNKGYRRHLRSRSSDRF